MRVRSLRLTVLQVRDNQRERKSETARSAARSFVVAEIIGKLKMVFKNSTIGSLAAEHGSRSVLPNHPFHTPIACQLSRRQWWGVVLRLDLKCPPPFATTRVD